MSERGKKVLTESALVLAVILVHFVTGVLPHWLGLVSIFVFTSALDRLYVRCLARREGRLSLPRGDEPGLNRLLTAEPTLNRLREDGTAAPPRARTPAA